MGLFKRRKESFDSETFWARPGVDEEMTRASRIATATQEDQLESERDRDFWRTLERRSHAVMLAVEELWSSGQAKGHSPEAARAGTLRACPSQFDLANRVEYEVWKHAVSAMSDTEFEREARDVEGQPKLTSCYHSAKVAFLADGRRRRGLPAGVIREPQSATDLQMREALGITGLSDERVALRMDIVMNALEAAVQAGIAAR